MAKIVEFEYIRHVTKRKSMFLKAICKCENFTTECKHRGGDGGDYESGYDGGGGDAGGGFRGFLRFPKKE